MDYKTKFRPLERLGRDGWRRMGECAEDTAAPSIDLPFRRQPRRLEVEA